MNKALLNNAANKRAFVKGYVEAVTAAGSSSAGSSSAGSSGHGSSPEDIEDLLVDCEMATVKAWPPVAFVGVPDTDLNTFVALVTRLSEFCSRARVPADPLEEGRSAALREELLDKGAFALIREWHTSCDDS